MVIGLGVQNIDIDSKWHSHKVALQFTSMFTIHVLGDLPLTSSGINIITSSFSAFQLYTAKLYKGRHEFLQLVPKRDKDKRPLKTFPLKGVNIKVTERKR